MEFFDCWSRWRVCWCFLADIPPIFTFCSGQFIFFDLFEQNASAMLSICIKVKVKAKASNSIKNMVRNGCSGGQKPNMPLKGNAPHPNIKMQKNFVKAFYTPQTKLNIYLQDILSLRKFFDLHDGSDNNQLYQQILLPSLEHVPNVILGHFELHIKA